ncbi:hypothetical protein GCM10023350_33530 [Nocardioides endophyticus]|uniref:REase associating with pPIWI RE domain-containing protein n=2 Tax=Nocardioides endophyticus TaxID=1353775 RepID=A0ABP8Z470_9ACTN
MYLGEQALRVVAGPTRVGYLVTAGDQDQFERAVAMASERWGGAGEPIIQVDPGGTVSDWGQQLLQVLDVAGLVNVGCKSSDAQQVASTAGLLVREEQAFARRDLPRAPTWRTGFAQGWDPVSARPHGPLWEKVAAGLLVGDESARAATEDRAGAAAAWGRTVLDAGLAGLAECSGRSAIPIGPAVIWLTDPDSFEDAAAFWNIRALRQVRFPSRMVLLPVRALTDWIGMEEILRDVVRRSQIGCAPDVVLCSSSIDEATLAGVAETLGLVPERGAKLKFSHSALPVFEPGDPTYLVNVDPAQWLTLERIVGVEDRFRVQVFRENTTLPVLPAKLAQMGTALNRFRFRFDGGFIDQLPRRPPVAAAVNPQCAWRGEMLECEVVPTVGSAMSIKAPSSENVLALLTEHASGALKLSDKGRLANALLNACDTTVLDNRSTLAAITALTTRRPGSWKKVVRELLEQHGPDEAAERMLEDLAGLGGRINRSYRSALRLGADHVTAEERVPVLERLATTGWVERGVEVVCDRCSINYFVTLESLTAGTQCPGCGASARVTTTGHGVECFYRLDAFADRCSDQGVVAHAAIGEVLTRDASFSALHLRVDVTWPDGTPEEVDLFGFLDASVVAGEVKSSAASFTQDQIERDVALSVRLNADVHVMACIEPLDQEALRILAEVCKVRNVAFTVVQPDNAGELVVS